MDDTLFSKDLDHYGIVASMCDQLGLVDIIDSLIPPDRRAEITAGECVKLMVINGLGFTARPLYLESQFFESKPIERLLGRKVETEKITDDRLGQCLDRCYETNCDLVFAKVATKAATRFNVEQRFRHLDTTSMHVHGEYAEEGIGLVEFGHSKDYRPDLKQFMISLICSQDGDVPLLVQTIPGNTSDKTHFRETLANLKSQIDPEQPAYYIADSALYTEKSLGEISSEMKWISRVPENLKAVKTLIHEVHQTDMTPMGNGYYVAEVGATYGDVRQRWLVVFSEKAQQREQKTLERRVKKTFCSDNKLLKELQACSFNCKEDAQAAFAAFCKKLKYHKCSKMTLLEKRTKIGRGRPQKDEKLETKYKIVTELVRDEDKITWVLGKKGKFVVATNELDPEKLSSQELLNHYKRQQSVERGFRFLKDPLFMCSSVFLKKEERIVALGMVMCLCLLVYTLSQRLLRLRIAQTATTLPNQKGQPTVKPTIRWIFQIFEGVHVLFQKISGTWQELVLNLNPLRIKILEVLGPSYQKMYENSG